jgi:hypothetical protein
MRCRIKVHYVIPILTLSNNGLRRIRDEDDIVFMLKFVDIGHHFFDLYLDHGDSEVAVDWDDVLKYPVRELPPVITPSSFQQTEEPDVDTAIPIQTVHPDYEVQKIRGRREGLRPRRNTDYSCTSDHHEAATMHFHSTGQSSRINEEEEEFEDQDD